MEEDCGSWLPEKHFDWQPPALCYLRDPQELGQLNSISSCMNIHANVMSTNPSLPIDAFSDLPHLQAGQANEPHGWFYCFPRFCQAFAPTPSVNKKPSGGPQQDLRQAIAPNAGPESDLKRFLVLDQSGDQMTLNYSSLFGNPVQPLVSWRPEPLAGYNVSGVDPGAKTPNSQWGPILTDEFNENHKADVESGLREDTEELNALLYSDDDSYDTEDDEETSTGHSPSTMTVQDNQDWFEGSRAEEVASSDGVSKRRRLSGGGFDVPSSLMDTASSVKPNGYLDSNFHDAESSCADSSNHQGSEKLVPLSGNKRMRRDRIHEMVSILQSIIPGGKGEDAVFILDEAIQYLKSLRVKAIALGLKTL